MSSRPEITALLSLSVQRYIDPHGDQRIYWARIHDLDKRFAFESMQLSFFDIGIKEAME